MKVIFDPLLGGLRKDDTVTIPPPPDKGSYLALVIDSTSIGTTTTSFTPTSDHVYEYIRGQNLNNCTVTLTSSSDFPVGGYCYIIRLAAGDIIFQAGTGVTLNAMGDRLAINGQVAMVIRVNSTTYDVIGLV